MKKESVGGTALSNYDLSAFLREWTGFLVSQGAMPATSYQEHCYYVRQHVGNVDDKLRELSEAFHQMSEMSDDEFIKYLVEMYAPLHPNWIADIVVADHYHFMKRLLEALSKRTSTHGVLDVGSGPAPHSVFLGSWGLVKSPIVCIDPVARLLEDGQKLAKSQGTEIQGIQGMISKQDLPVASESFDLVLGIDVLHWTFSWANGLKQMIRALRPGGTLFVTYAPFAKRARAKKRDLRELLINQGMVDISIEEFPAPVSLSPRFVITATKR